MTIFPAARHQHATLYGIRTTGPDGERMVMMAFVIGLVVLNSRDTPAANDP